MVTRNYIKMCGRAEEVQKLWIPGLGDICINKIDDKEVMIVASRGKIIDKEYKFVYLGIGGREQPDYWHRKDKLTLLPTQEWLQEVWEKEYLENPNEYGWFGCFVEFMGKEYIKENEIDFAEIQYVGDPIAEEYFDTMNELWLAFVMHEKYHKIWDGNDWQIKEIKNDNKNLR